MQAVVEAGMCFPAQILFALTFVVPIQLLSTIFPVYTMPNVYPPLSNTISINISLLLVLV